MSHPVAIAVELALPHCNDGFALVHLGREGHGLAELATIPDELTIAAENVRSGGLDRGTTRCDEDISCCGWRIGELLDIELHAGLISMSFLVPQYSRFRRGRNESLIWRASEATVLVANRGVEVALSMSGVRGTH